jgi:Calpain family cysteine protease
MANRPNDLRRRHDNRLSVERLESRVMMAMDLIESNLQLLSAPDIYNSPPIVSVVAPAAGNAPSIATPLRLTSGTEVTGRTAIASVLGKDNKPESSLRYTWTALEIPSGGSVRFATNGSNSAKTNTLTFGSAGTYSVQVMIRDSEGLTTTSELRFNVRHTVTSLSVRSLSGQAINSNQTIRVDGASHQLNVIALDQFGTPMATQPSVRWQAAVGSPSGVSLSSQSGVNKFVFPRVGTYSGSLQAGNVTNTLRFDVRPTLTRVQFLGPNNVPISTSNPIVLAAKTTQIAARGLDQFGQTMTTQPKFVWSRVESPSGALPKISSSGNIATLTFTQSGLHTFRASAKGQAFNVDFNVTQTLTRIEIPANSVSLASGASRQYQAIGIDQFGLAMTTSPRVAWSATGGTIDSSGTYVAGTAAGNFTVTARSGSFVASTPVRVTVELEPAPTPSPTPTPAPTPTPTNNGIVDTVLASLVQTYYVDGKIDRSEMIDILENAGNDGTVSAIELADFRYIVSSSSPYVMPAHVRELARDVVNSNAANATFQGQSAGNLTAGSSTSLLSKLIDKWFRGADLPVLTSSSFSYRNAVGTLFNTAPELADARQGYLGDCYFIASLASIAAKNVDAIRDMFIDNGDGTFTIRFFTGSYGNHFSNSVVTSGFISGTGVADYITVNRQLPTYSNGALAYSGNGLSASSSTTPLWIALAEKAYAQWNQTGNSGRDGTNRYSSIEGGWMTQVNAQVLGYNSTNHLTSSSSKQTLVNAVNSNQAVTIGTQPGATTGGLIGGHAYVVTGYNASTDRFTLHNPWGVEHPTPLNWAQLQSDTSMFVVTNTSGSSTLQGGIVSSETTEVLIGNWTQVVQNHPLSRSNFSDDSQPTSMDATESPLVKTNDLATVTVKKTSPETPIESEKPGKENATVAIDFVFGGFGIHENWLMA